MTQTKINTREKRITPKKARWIFPAALCGTVIVFILSSQTVSAAVSSALGLCVRAVIPSVFPCMVLSRLIVGCGGGELFGRVLGRITERLFGVSRAAAAPILLGALCGFPVGVSVADRLYRRGELTLCELESIIGFVSLPSPAFVINAVGASMLGDRRRGIILYILIVSISLILGIVVCRTRSEKPRAEPIVRVEDRKTSISELTVDAVGSSATAMLGVCAYTVFFSVLSATLKELLSLSPTLSALIGGALEFSGGCFLASSLPNSFPICAAILGWSGLGVHFQIMSVCSKGISYKKFYMTIILRSLLCLAASTVILRVFDI